MNKKLDPAKLLEINRKVASILDDYRRLCEEGTNRSLSDVDLVPVDVEAIAHGYGLTIELVEKIYEGSDIRGRLDSGALVVADGLTRVGTRRFTIGHELGHHVLEGNGNYFRTVHQPGRLHQHANEPKELAADAFSALLLMPEKAVLRHFCARFGGPMARRRCDEATALFLGKGVGKSLNVLQLRRAEPFELAKMLSRSLSFGGPPFEPLSKTFNVSPLSMARRLIDLALIS
jgi:hypothetical protein